MNNGDIWHIQLMATTWRDDFQKHVIEYPNEKSHLTPMDVPTMTEMVQPSGLGPISAIFWVIFFGSNVLQEGKNVASEKQP